MNETEFQFRTAAIGGFQKQDVLAYLEASAREHAEKMAALRREMEGIAAERDEAERSCDTLEGRLAVLEAENQRLAADLAQREEELLAATARRDALERECGGLRAEVEKLTPAATAYETVKDRAAGIELEAHGRAQAIEAEAQRKARKTRDQVGDWLEKMQAAYGRLRVDLDATLSHATGELERVEQSLTEISGQFASHDEALRALTEQLGALDSPKMPNPLPLEEQK